MKRFLAILLSCVLLCSMLSFAVADEKKSLTVWIPTYQFSKAEDAISDLDFWTQQFADFQTENNCDVHIEILPWGDYNTTIFTGLLNNDGPDVVYVTDTYDLVQNDLLLGLDSYLTAEEIDNYMLWNNAPLNAAGEHCTVPMNDGAVLMLYNKTILAEAGIETVPETWDDFIAACKTIKEKTGKQAFLQNWGATTGTSALMTGFWPYYFQAGGKMLDANGEIAINNEAGLATVSFINKLYTEGIFDETITAETAMLDKFGEGNLAFVAVGDSTGINTATRNNIDYGYILSLKGSAGYGTRTACDSFAVAKMAQTRGTTELAIKALKLVCSGKVMDAFHEHIYYLPRFTKDAQFVKDVALDKLYTENASALQVVVEFEGKPSFEKALQSNIQLMFMGDLTPQEVLDETMTYYADQIKQ